MFKEWWCCCYNPLTRLSCNCVKSSHLCKVLVFGNFSRVSFKFSPKLCQYYHVIKKNFATLKLKCVSKTFLLAPLCISQRDFVHFSAGLFGQNQYSCQLKVLRISLEKSPQSPLNIMLLTSEEKNENKFVLNLWNCKVWDWNFMSIKPGRNYGRQSSRY